MFIDIMRKRKFQKIEMLRFVHRESCDWSERKRRCVRIYTKPSAVRSVRLGWVCSLLEVNQNVSVQAEILIMLKKY